MTVLCLSCSTTSNSNSKTSSKYLTTPTMSLFSMINMPIIGTTLSGQKIKMGGFSGLQFTGEREGALYFQAITDRGPSSEIEGVDRSFLLPEFSPTIVTLKADLATKVLSVAAEIKLKKKDGTLLTGLPNNRNEENPIDVFGLYYSVDSQGLDTEGLVADGEGGWWLAEKYSPSLVHINQEAQVLRRVTPGNELPRMYAERKMNSGFEGVAKIDNKVFGFLQSPIPKDNAIKGDFSRIVELDLDTMKTSAEYFYLFEKGNNKIGDAVAVGPKSFLVIEQNGKIGEQSQKYIYKISIGESDQLVKKTRIADLKNTAFNDVEKVEGMTLIDNHRLALVYNNDFQINGQTNHATGLTPSNESHNQLLIMEFTESLKDE
jgi:3-phytase